MQLVLVIDKAPIIRADIIGALTTLYRVPKKSESEIKITEAFLW